MTQKGLSYEADNVAFMFSQLIARAIPASKNARIRFVDSFFLFFGGSKRRVPSYQCR